MKITIYTSNSAGKASNCDYPNKHTVVDEKTLIEAVRLDNVSAEFKDNKRNIGNFIGSDNIVMDIDNDHSEEPGEWITKEKILKLFDGIAFALVPSRNHMKQKGDKAPREKYHIYFQIPYEADSKKYAEYKRSIFEAFPFFDSNALDSARFIFGCNPEEVYISDASGSILDIVDEAAFANYDSSSKEIKQGGRNNHMSRFAGMVLKRYGNTEEAKQAFIDESKKCMPPLEDSELRTIWHSAQSFYKNKVATQPGYVAPANYVGNWTNMLKRGAKSGAIIDSVENLVTILNNDPDFKNIAYNELANRVQVVGPVPWNRPLGNKFWREADTAQLKALIDKRYFSFSTRNHDVAFMKVTDDRHFHPVRDYLDSLPKWDGVGRVDDLFIKYLLADDTDYVRTVTRKTFVAAVARVYEPGIKFDCVPVLDGAQGIGKSSLVKDLTTNDFYSDSLTLTDMDDKAGAEKLQGFWIVEIGELAGMKKADVEKVKAFITTSDDKYRPSYGRTVESHPRQNIIIATVNGERGYLRDITGNRRFWVIKLHQTEQRHRWSFDQNYRDQFWAEAKEMYLKGEKLYLEGAMIAESEKEQQKAMEVDERVGMVEEYLNTPVPSNWEDMNLFQRRSFFEQDPTSAKGTMLRDTISNAEIWCECFGKDLSSIKPTDSYAIAALMVQVPGWERTQKIKKSKLYGRQRLYERSGTKAE